jgi:hypothetical protein
MLSVQSGRFKNQGTVLLEAIWLLPPEQIVQY